jgi:hypothetical protein
MPRRWGAVAGVSVGRWKFAVSRVTLGSLCYAQKLMCKFTVAIVCVLLVGVMEFAKDVFRKQKSGCDFKEFLLGIFCEGGGSGAGMFMQWVREEVWRRVGCGRG